MVKSLDKKIKIDWEFIDHDTSYLTHNIHRYSGKFIPHIAKHAIDLLTQKGDTVLDFYSGSGTTLLEAMLAERKSIGIDINPLAILIAKVKTTTISESIIHAQTNVLHNKLQSNVISKVIHDDPRLRDEWFLKWFQPKILTQLCNIHHEITMLEDEDFKNVALVAFSDIVRKVSNAHSGYPNVMLDKKKVIKIDAISIYQKRLDEITDSVLQLSKFCLPKKNNPKILMASAEKMPLKSASVDAIVTHPPYVASIPYAEYGSLSLKWLNHSPHQIDKVLTGGCRQKANVLERFKTSYQQAITEAHRVLKNDGSMFLMVGNPTIKGDLFELQTFTKKICLEAGFEFMKMDSRNGQNRRANKMGKEYLLFFQKKK